MNRTTIALVAALAVAAALVAAPAAAQNDNDAAASTNISFGSQISIIVSAQQAQVEQTVENEAFDVAFGERGGEAVSERAQELAEKMKQLEEEKEELDEARENGSVSASEYRTKMAKLETRAQAVNDSANHTVTKAEKGLSQAERQGVNVDAIRELMRNASELTGPEVAEIARSIAGPAMAAQRAGNRTPGDVGPPEDAGPAMGGNDSGPGDRAADRVPDSKKPADGGGAATGGPGPSTGGGSGGSGGAGGGPP